MHHFAGLKQTFRLLSNGPDSELLGQICCAGGPLLRIPQLKDSVQWYVDAAKKAGSEVMTDARISPATQEILDRPLAPDPAAYAERINAYFAGLGIERIKTPKPE